MGNVTNWSSFFPWKNHLLAKSCVHLSRSRCNKMHEPLLSSEWFMHNVSKRSQTLILCTTFSHSVPALKNWEKKVCTGKSRQLWQIIKLFILYQTYLFQNYIDRANADAHVISSRLVWNWVGQQCKSNWMNTSLACQSELFLCFCLLYICE